MIRDDKESNERARHVRIKAERMASARKSRDSFWKSIIAGGTLGWAFILPTLAGVVLGRMIAAWTHFPAATLIGLVFGMVVGGFAVYWNVRRSLSNETKGQSP